MANIDLGGPAFPRRHENGQSLLDHLAGLAMKAILGRSGKDPSVVAQESYEQATAMVKEKRRLEG